MELIGGVIILTGIYLATRGPQPAPAAEIVEETAEETAAL